MARAQHQPKKDAGYQGWSNYETWAVALWLDNDEGSYRHVRELAGEAREARTTPSREPRGILADAIKEFVEENAPDLEASVYSDLLGAALGEVDYYEIAEAILAES